MKTGKRIALDFSNPTDIWDSAVSVQITMLVYPTFKSVISFLIFLLSLKSIPGMADLRMLHIQFRMAPAFDSRSESTYKLIYLKLLEVLNKALELKLSYSSHAPYVASSLRVTPLDSTKKIDYFEAIQYLCYVNVDRNKGRKLSLFWDALGETPNERDWEYFSDVEAGEEKFLETKTLSNFGILKTSNSANVKYEETITVILGKDFLLQLDYLLGIKPPHWYSKAQRMFTRGIFA